MHPSCTQWPWPFQGGPTILMLAPSLAHAVCSQLNLLWSSPSKACAIYSIEEVTGEQMWGGIWDKVPAQIEHKIDSIQSALEIIWGGIQSLGESLAHAQLWLEYFHVYSNRFLAQFHMAPTHQAQFRQWLPKYRLNSNMPSHCWASLFLPDLPSEPMLLSLMDPSSQEYVCHCRHVFAQSGHLICHQRTCWVTKVLLVGALAKAKDFLRTKKGWCLERLRKNVTSSSNVSNPACHQSHEHASLSLLRTSTTQEGIWMSMLIVHTRQILMQKAPHLFPHYMQVIPF